MATAATSAATRNARPAAVQRPGSVSRNASSPTTPCSAAKAKNARSIPSTGSITNVATRGPHIAPVVLASVSHEAARVSTATTRLSASPSSVKMTPDSREVTNASENANQRMRDHSAAHGPVATNRNATYDSTETKRAAKATDGR